MCIPDFGHKTPACVVLGDTTGECIQILDYYASKGCSVAFMSEQKELGCRVKEALKNRYKTEVFFFHGDSESEEDMDYFAGGIGGKFGRVDYFVNYACTHPCLGPGSCEVNHISLAMRDAVAKPYAMIKKLGEYFTENSYVFNVANSYCYNGPQGERNCNCPIQRSMDAVLNSIGDHLGARVKVYGIGHDEKEDSKVTGRKIISMIDYLASHEGAYMDRHMVELDELKAFVFYNGEDV